MDANSPKPPQTGFDQFEVIKVLRDWLDREGGNHRIPQVLDLLAEHTARAWTSGQPSPSVDPDTLRQFHAEAHGGRIADMPASRWLSSSGVQTWWDARRDSLVQAFRTARIDVMPTLSIVPGGGRGNQTLYRLGFEPKLMLNETGEDGPPLMTSDSAKGGVIHYEVEPAKAAWWLQLIFGNEPFRMRSWRGYLLVGMIAAEALCLLLIWLGAFLSMRGPSPLSAQDLAYLLLAAIISYAWLQIMKPVIRLPVERVTIANDLLLGYFQFNGQFKLKRDGKSKVAGGWFQLVRHHATCPICSGEVEIAEGGEAFPGRLVGRCSESPLEHVFSFDPVVLQGQWLLSPMS